MALPDPTGEAGRVLRQIVADEDRRLRTPPHGDPLASAGQTLEDYANRLLDDYAKRLVDGGVQFATPAPTPGYHFTDKFDLDVDTAAFGDWVGLMLGGAVKRPPATRLERLRGRALRRAGIALDTATDHAHGWLEALDRLAARTIQRGNVLDPRPYTHTFTTDEADR